MNKITASILVISASLTLAACGGSGSGGNSDPKPIIKDTNPVATVAFEAPQDFLTFNYVSSDGGVLGISLYLTYDPSFTDEVLKAKNFVVNGATEFSDHVPEGQLMTVAAYNNDSRLVLSDVLGVMPANPTETFKANLNAVGTAITQGVVSLDSLSLVDGIEDDIGSLNLAETVDAAAVTALRLEGYSRTDAKNATDTVKNTALEAALTGEAERKDLKRLFNNHLNESTWTADNGSYLFFTGDMISYRTDSSGVATKYTVTMTNGKYELTASMGSLGDQTIDLTSLMNGNGTMSFLSQTYTRQ